MMTIRPGCLALVVGNGHTVEAVTVERIVRPGDICVGKGGTFKLGDVPEDDVLWLVHSVNRMCSGAFEARMLLRIDGDMAAVEWHQKEEERVIKEAAERKKAEEAKPDPSIWGYADELPTLRERLRRALLRRLGKGGIWP